MGYYKDQIKDLKKMIWKTRDKKLKKVYKNMIADYKHKI